MKPSPQLPPSKVFVLLFAASVLFAALATSVAAFQSPTPPRTATPPGRPTATPTPARTNPPATTTTPPPRPLASPPSQATPPPRPAATATPTPMPSRLDFGGIRTGETTWSHWLYLLIGVLFFVVAGYMVYSAMLPNQIRANRHPANFRRAVIASVLLLSIIWFGWVFRDAFHWLMLVVLLAVWLVVVLVFIFTKRKGVAPQD